MLRATQGCGIVEFETPDGAAAAILQLHDTELGGRKIWVRSEACLAWFSRSVSQPASQSVVYVMPVLAAAAAQGLRLLPGGFLQGAAAKRAACMANSRLRCTCTECGSLSVLLSAGRTARTLSCGARAALAGAAAAAVTAVAAVPATTEGTATAAAAHCSAAAAVAAAAAATAGKQLGRYDAGGMAGQCAVPKLLALHSPVRRVQQLQLPLPGPCACLSVACLRVITLLPAPASARSGFGGGREGATVGRRVYVGNLPFDTTWQVGRGVDSRWAAGLSQLLCGKQIVGKRCMSSAARPVSLWGRQLPAWLLRVHYRVIRSSEAGAEGPLQGCGACGARRHPRSERQGSCVYALDCAPC